MASCSGISVADASRKGSRIEIGDLTNNTLEKVLVADVLLCRRSHSQRTGIPLPLAMWMERLAFGTFNQVS